MTLQADSLLQCCQQLANSMRRDNCWQTVTHKRYTLDAANRGQGWRPRDASSDRNRPDGGAGVSALAAAISAGDRGVQRGGRGGGDGDVTRASSSAGAAAGDRAVLLSLTATPNASRTHGGPHPARLSPRSQRLGLRDRYRARSEAEKTDAHLSRRERNGVWSDRHVGGLGAVRSVSVGNEPTGAWANGHRPCGVVSLGSLLSACCSDCGRRRAFDDDQARRCFVCQCIAELSRGRVAT
jgi:hypothetical protein